MPLPDAKSSINQASEIRNDLYSVIINKDEIPEIVEGEIENAVFSGTYKECQAEILMSLMLD